MARGAYIDITAESGGRCGARKFQISAEKENDSDLQCDCPARPFYQARPGTGGDFTFSADHNQDK